MSRSLSVPVGACFPCELTSLSSLLLFWCWLTAEALSLSEPESYRYLNQSGCVNDENLNDAEMFSKVMVSPRPHGNFCVQSHSSALE